MKEMSEYTVEWTCDVMAESPEDAARLAHVIMSDPRGPVLLTVTDASMDHPYQYVGAVDVEVSPNGDTAIMS